MSEQDKSPFHAAEVSVQQRLGVAGMVAQYSAGFIRGAMPQQHRDFFSELPFVILGLVDQSGYPWAMPLFGKEGFISSPSDTILNIDALPSLSSLLELNFKQGQKLGLLGIQLATRRRNRMNGVIDSIGKAGFSVRVEQSFGNCPQYIQTRELAWQNNESVRQGFSDIDTTHYIDLRSKSFIEQADTFFISSRTKNFDNDARSGIDASHRGGKPGFVKVEGDTLYFPDFSGNKFFNTLGNIQSDNRVGLFFPDYSTGNAIFIAGHAETLWDDPAIGVFDGAERIIKISVKKVVNIPKFMPMTGELIELSPVLESTGQWSNDETPKESDTYRPFKLTDKRKESDTITSFYFSSIAESSIKPYLPGQFLPIQLNIPEQERPVLRHYTLSQATTDNGYRISVKREAKGLVSKYLHDHVNIGDSVNVGTPAGQFTLQHNNHAVVLISGGVGITPMLAMLEGIIAEVKQGVMPRPVWFIHGTQNSETQAFAKQINAWADQYDWLHVHTVYSSPLVDDELGQTHHSEGRISIELLKSSLPFDHYDFYLCGSEGFMRAIYAGLIETGVAKNNIYYEFFGEGSIEEHSIEEHSIEKKDNSAVADRATVTFFKANISEQWTPQEGSLLEFAEKQGLTPLNSCRSGNCGACACKLTAGEVSYHKKPSFKVQQDEVLICCAKPTETDSEVVIEL